MRGWKTRLLLLLAAAGAAAACLPASAQQAGTQFVGILGYRVGPYGANGAAFFSGFIDYLSLVNERDGGINGVKLSWEECETEYNNTKGVECYERVKTMSPTGPTAIHPLSTGITYSLIDKAPADKIPLITLGYGEIQVFGSCIYTFKDFSKALSLVEKRKVDLMPLITHKFPLEQGIDAFKVLLSRENAQKVLIQIS